MLNMKINMKIVCKTRLARDANSREKYTKEDVVAGRKKAKILVKGVNSHFRLIGGQPSLCSVVPGQLLGNHFMVHFALDPNCIQSDIERDQP